MARFHVGFRPAGLWLCMILGASVALTGCSDDDPPKKDDCSVDTDCAAHEQCSAAKVCELKPNRCDTDTDCTGDKTCDATKTCVDPPKECTVQTDCAWNQLCTDSKCVADPDAPECVTADHCAANEVCTDDGECLQLECETNDECEDYQTCSDENVCVDNPAVPVARRIQTLSLLSPNFNLPPTEPTDPSEEPNTTCTPITALLNVVLGGMLNGTDDDSGDYNISIVLEQIDKVSNTNVGSMNVVMPVCRPADPPAEEEDPSPDTCTIVEADRVASADFAKQLEDGVCFERVPEETNADGYRNYPELPIDPAAVPETVVADDAQCLSTAAFDVVELDLGGIVLALTGLKASAQYVVPEPLDYEVGVIEGFLSKEAAETLLPADLPLVGGHPISALLTNGVGGCVDDTTEGREVDLGPDGEGGTTEGWWLQLGYTAKTVVVPEPI